MSANVKVTNLSPFEVEIGAHRFDNGVHEAYVKNPEFFAHYVTKLGFDGLSAEVIGGSEAPATKAAGKTTGKGE